MLLGNPPISPHTQFNFRIGLDTMASNDTSADLLFAKWNGQIVPRSFNGGFVTLSYIVSLIGAASTLELINRRTAPKGKVNQYVESMGLNADLCSILMPCHQLTALYRRRDDGWNFHLVHALYW